jgi:hypothetical protein
MGIANFNPASRSVACRSWADVVPFFCRSAFHRFYSVAAAIHVRPPTIACG